MRVSVPSMRITSRTTKCTVSSLIARYKTLETISPMLRLIATRGSLASQWRHRGYGPRYTVAGNRVPLAWAATT